MPHDEVISQLIEFANQNEDIRAVVMNGSRVNQNAPVDQFQDYDVIFFYTDLSKERYKADTSWIHRFGDLVICQQNDFEDGYIFLMQFFDGLRIDAGFRSIDTVNEVIKSDSLTKVLLDKDNRIASSPVPSESSYWLKKPTEKEWDETLNELFWIQSYVMKAVYRDEETMAHYMYHSIFLQVLQTLVSWSICFQRDWRVNIGACNKWLKKYLTIQEANDFYSLCNVSSINEYAVKLKKARVLIRYFGIPLSEKLGYTYPTEYDKNVEKYINNFADIYNIKHITI